MKITVYTINDCPFSKQEKDYLSTNKLAFEEKNLETNKEFLTEMLTVSNNFAGTPVTKVEKDDGQIAILKGFTKEEFDKTFGFETVSPMVGDKPIEETNAKMDVPPTQAPAGQSPLAGANIEPPKAETPEPVKVEPASAEATAGKEPKAPEPAGQSPLGGANKPDEQVVGAPDPLDAILNDLKTKSGEEITKPEEPTIPKEETLSPTPPPTTTPAGQSPMAGSQPPTTMPTSTTTPPTIPDFQAK